ncbi:MAG: bifunctional diaminohydroxyphosphoribosylaminopyrimidine deaminase/5-amino-6-(5-phosphoribosylamino)uracil reductase RibD [Desulforhopalus sp.]
MNDDMFMRLAIREAKKGMGWTSPNPCVGAVIVRNNEVIAKGYHKKAGTPHAEIHALRKAGAMASGATIYVTLEPCNHTGKTPPCSHALVEAGIGRVVVGMTDPNPVVNGSGIDYLRLHGIEVISGVLQDQCEELNQPFIKHITQNIPWVIMKAGLSLDGRLNYKEGQAGWITGDQSLRDVHKLRNRVDAIMVGRGTVEIDNPSLTTRLSGVRSKDPVRVIVDSNLSTSLDAKVYNLDSNAPTMVFCGNNVSTDRVELFRNHGVKIYTVNFGDQGLDLHQILIILGQCNICSLLVEGGASLHGAFLQQKLFDYACLYYAPLFAGDKGIPLIAGYGVDGRSSAPRLFSVQRRKLGDDIVVSGKLDYPN